ncbi:MAG: hypothetical protein KJP00_10790 [Bacteroidia bacterium]|nr:hypothetical protein [Bacteroidia bacterium]
MYHSQNKNVDNTHSGYVTHHSEYLPLKEVFMKSAEHAYISVEQVRDQWNNLNYLSQPNYANALEEYDGLVNIIRDSGAKIYNFPVDEEVNIDSIYCRDASIATDFGMIICRMGKSERLHEPIAQRRVFEAHKIPILGEIQAPGTLEGGDVTWLDENTLAVGHTYRTNHEGIRQLKNLLEPKGIEVVVAELPHYKGSQDVFHLMSILSPVDKDLAVVYSPLMPIQFRNDLKDRGFLFVEVPEDEFESMGCNVLALAPRKCIMLEGNPKTRDAIITAGGVVTTYKGNEISSKGGGGPTCLTRPMKRTLL